MPPIRKILVPLDGSSDAEASLDHARSVARPLDAGLHLVRVVTARGPEAGPDPVRWRLAKRDAEAYLAERGRRLRDDGFEVEESVLAGRPAEEIVSHARRHGADLVVLTRGGAGGSRGAPMGGTAHKVVYRIGASVLLLEPGPAGSPNGGAPYRKIMVPVDGSPASEWALRTAASLLPAAGGELLVARVLEPGGGDAGDRTRRDAEAGLEEMRRRVQRPGVRIETSVLSGECAARRLHALADERNVDLVMPSAHGRSGATPWPYGSVATNLLLHGRRPTLVLQDQPDRARAEPPRRAEPVRPERTEAGRSHPSESAARSGPASTSRS